MQKTERQPLLWLWIQILCMAALVCFSGRYGLSLSKDSQSYLQFFNVDPSLNQPFLKLLFSQYRTFGYPLWLKGISLVSPDLHLLPLAQYLLHAAAVLLFWKSLRFFGISSWLAFAAAVPLLYSRLILSHVQLVMADAPAVSMAVVVVSFLFFTASGTSRKSFWAGYTVALFLLYQLRPAYLFMLLSAPVLGTLFVLFRQDVSGVQKKISVWGRHFLFLLLFSILPYLTFCALRQGLTGHFGLTSFGGISTTGMATAMLDEETLVKLSPDVRPVAAGILALKSAGTETQSIRGNRLHWKQHTSWVYAHNLYMWKMAIPVAEKFLHTELQTGTLQINRLLKKMSKEIIRARPLIYGQFVLLSVERCLVETLRMNFMLQGSILLFLAAVIIHLVFNRAQKIRGPYVLSETHLFALLAVLFYLTKILSVCLVAKPDLRFYEAAEIFLPSIFMVAAFRLFRSASENPAI